MDKSDLDRALAELPREVEPPRDLWAGIGARIEAKRQRGAVVRRIVTGTSVFLAAAAVLLSVRFTHKPHVVDPSRPAPAPTVILPVPEVEAQATLEPEEDAYHAALTALSSRFEEKVKELPADELHRVEASLRTLDGAIDVTRAALADHPEDADLRAELDGEYEQKIQTMNDVLDWTTRS